MRHVEVWEYLEIKCAIATESSSIVTIYLGFPSGYKLSEPLQRELNQVIRRPDAIIPVENNPFALIFPGNGARIFGDPTIWTIGFEPHFIYSRERLVTLTEMLVRKFCNRTYPLFVVGVCDII